VRKILGITWYYAFLAFLGLLFVAWKYL